MGIAKDEHDMILIDSNILIDYYRNRKSELAKKIDSMKIAICGVVKSEVLHYLHLMYSAATSAISPLPHTVRR